MEDNTEKMLKIALLMLVLLMILKVCSFKHTGALDDAFIKYMKSLSPRYSAIII